VAKGLIASQNRCRCEIDPRGQYARRTGQSAGARESDAREEEVADVSSLLFEPARIPDGEVPDDPAAFAARLNRLVLRGLPASPIPYLDPSEAFMAHATVNQRRVPKLDFDRRLMLQFRGSVVTSDAGLLAYRELDVQLGFTAMAGEILAGARIGENGRHALVGLLRRSLFERRRIRGCQRRTPA
jgi:hypothetical protein